MVAAASRCDPQDSNRPALDQRALVVAADLRVAGDRRGGGQALRELPAVQEFLARYPGVPPSAVAVTTGFPAWLRLLHFLNLFFMAFIIRAGVQILADHPRLYWKRDCTPGTEWFRFQKPVPSDRIW